MMNHSTKQPQERQAVDRQKQKSKSLRLFDLKELAGPKIAPIAAKVIAVCQRIPDDKLASSVDIAKHLGIPFSSVDWAAKSEYVLPFKVMFHRKWFYGNENTIKKAKAAKGS